MTTLALPPTRPLADIPRWLIYAAGGALLVVAILTFTILRSHAAVRYVTAPVAQQTLVQSVTASGTVNPQNNISVGTEVSGTIQTIYVDYNSKVKKGQVLARIDPSSFQAQLDQADAGLAQSQALAAEAGANANGATAGITIAAGNATAQQDAAAAARDTIAKAQAALTLAQTTDKRDEALYAQGYVPKSSVDADREAIAGDASDVASAQAAAAQSQATAQASSATAGQSGSTAQAQADAASAAQAAVAAAAATVRSDQLSLDHSVIVSPVDGTVVARDVSVGQTVAASLATPTLFSIAQDLSKMEVDINVGEPDIGNVKPGEAVSFSVLAYPGQTFDGTVSQVRINPQTVNNVVTYDVVVQVNNANGKLLPGMTANATIDVASAKNALVVPAEAVHAAKNGAQSPWGATAGGATAATAAAGSTGTIVVLRNGKTVRIPVTVNLITSTQAAVTPVAPATLAAGDQVVTGAASPQQRTGHANGTAGSLSPIGGSAAGMRGIH
jgi:HlyD family secretion protein